MHCHADVEDCVLLMGKNKIKEKRLDNIYSNLVKNAIIATMVKQCVCAHSDPPLLT